MNSSELQCCRLLPFASPLASEVLGPRRGLKCSVTKSIGEMGLPHLAMGVVPEEQDLRVCRTLILKRYERLETIGSAEGFRTVFVHVVRGT